MRARRQRPARRRRGLSSRRDPIDANGAAIIAARMRKSICATGAIVAAITCATAHGAGDADVQRALDTVRAQAEAGNVVAQFSLGSMLYYGGDATAQAIAWIRAAAAHEYAPAEFHMGQLYDFGFGVTRNDNEALAWYRKAAEHGSAAGLRAVGDFYYNGRGTPADAVEAGRWYRRAADADDL